MTRITAGGGRSTPQAGATPALIVLAKAPVPGRVKTRLSPPCTPEQAADLAHAALRDTLGAVLGVPDARRVLVIDGEAGPWVPRGFEVFAQRGEGLGERLGAAFDDVGYPALLVGMDTPQLDPQVLGEGLDALLTDVDAVLGPAADGGYWSVGLRHRVRGAFAGVPMSVAHTCVAQRQRFEELGLRVFEQRTLRDVDVIGDAHVVAKLAPNSRFAAAVASLA